MSFSAQRTISLAFYKQGTAPFVPDGEPVVINERVGKACVQQMMACHPFPATSFGTRLERKIGLGAPIKCNNQRDQRVVSSNPSIRCRGALGLPARQCRGFEKVLERTHGSLIVK